MTVTPSVDEPLGAVTSVTPAKIRRLRRAVNVETDWVRISSASTDIDDSGRGIVTTKAHAVCC